MAWWVAAAMCLGGTVLFAAVAIGVEVEGGTAAVQAILMMIVLGGATLGSWFLEAAERRAFAQGLLVDHLYQRIDHLFRQYLSPDVAQALVDDPKRAELGEVVAVVFLVVALAIGLVMLLGGALDPPDCPDGQTWQCQTTLFEKVTTTTCACEDAPGAP